MPWHQAYIQVDNCTMMKLDPGEPREHHLGEVLQGRSKSKFNIILSNLIVLFFWVQVSIIKTIYKFKKVLFQNSLLK